MRTVIGRRDGHPARVFTRSRLEDLMQALVRQHGRLSSFGSADVVGSGWAKVPRTSTAGRSGVRWGCRHRPALPVAAAIRGVPRPLARRECTVLDKWAVGVGNDHLKDDSVIADQAADVRFLEKTGPVLHCPAQTVTRLRFALLHIDLQQINPRDLPFADDLGDGFERAVERPAGEPLVEEFVHLPRGQIPAAVRPGLQERPHGLALRHLVGESAGEDRDVGVVAERGGAACAG